MTTSKGRKRKASVPASVPDRPYLLEWLKNPANAAAYVEAALEEGDAAGLMQALRNVAEARGGVAVIADKTGLNREALYRTLSKRGNPQLNTLAAILSATGLRLSVECVAVVGRGRAGRVRKPLFSAPHPAGIVSPVRARH